MGCRISRATDSNTATLFIIKSARQGCPPFKSNTPPKKELLGHGEKYADKDNNGEIGDDHERAITRGNEDCPGSPSFRVYFTENDKCLGDIDEEDDDGDGDFNDDDFVDAVSRNENNISSQEEEEEGSVKRRSGNKKGLRKVLPRGGQAAMKNGLMNVKSFVASTRRQSSSRSKSNSITQP